MSQGIHPSFDDASAKFLADNLWLPNENDISWNTDNIGFFNTKSFSSTNKHEPILDIKSEYTTGVNKVLTRSFRFYPTKDQKIILRNMEQAYRWTYNVTSYIIEKHIQPFYTQHDHNVYITRRHERTIENMNKDLTEKQTIALQNNLTKKLESKYQQESLLRKLQKEQECFPNKNLVKKFEAKEKAIQKLNLDISQIQFKLDGGKAITEITIKEDFHDDFEATNLRLVWTSKARPLARPKGEYVISSSLNIIDQLVKIIFFSLIENPLKIRLILLKKNIYG